MVRMSRRRPLQGTSGGVPKIPGTVVRMSRGLARHACQICPNRAKKNPRSKGSGDLNSKLVSEAGFEPAHPVCGH